MSGTPRTSLPGPTILIGIMRVARGRADGLPLFGDSVPAFTASLAPFVALPLVGSALMMMDQPGWAPLSELLSAWCALLAPPVISWELARRWERQAAWLRYATAFNWCMWAVPMFAFLLLLVLGFAAQLGMPSEAAALALPAGLAAYALWLHWFLARHGLGISAGRAALLVLLVNLGTGIVVFGPALLALARPLA
jgi:hypothetical protein